MFQSKLLFQSSNKRILFNLLPAHVATHFLDNQFRNNLVKKKETIQTVSLDFQAKTMYVRLENPKTKKS